MAHLSRRDLFNYSGQAAVGLGSVWLLSSLAACTTAEEAASGEKFTVEEATNATAALSPDGRTVVFDLLKMLWVVPIAGGGATRLRGGAQDADVVAEFSHPDFSPDGRRIVCQSYQDGQFRLVLMNLDGTGQKVLTAGETDCREPRFSPDGSRIAFSGESGDRYAIRVLDVASGAITDWTKGDRQEAQPTWSPDGRTIAFLSGKNDSSQSIEAVDADGGRRTLVQVGTGRLAGPSYAPDGTFGYVRLGPTEAGDYYGTSSEAVLVVGERTVSVAGEDVFPAAPRWLSATEVLYVADGKFRRRNIQSGAVTAVPFTAELTVQRVTERASARDFDSTAERPVKGLVNAALSPDATQVLCMALGKIWLLRDGAAPQLVIDDGNFNSEPSWSSDGRSIVYVSDRAGQNDIWLHDLTTGEQRQLTHLTGAESSPVLSPDGTMAAFLSGTFETGTSLCTLTIATDEIHTLVGSLVMPGRPSFSHDGTKLSLAGFVPVTPRFREGSNQILTVDLATGAAHYSSPIPGKSLSDRVDAGPVYSPDGRHIAFTASGTAWICDVDDQGRPTGQPRQVNTENADFPTWSGDSTRLLYLSNGQLRMADILGGTTRSITPRFTWRPQVPTSTRLIKVGALWDGESRELRRNMQILVRGNRIAAIGDNLSANGADVIDAGDLTVMPGMIATHEHVGNLYLPSTRTNRLWLALGITTLRSPGTAHYWAVEAKEAQESGNRIGPRMFCSGPLNEGNRAFYGIARPITDSQDLRRELDRASALGHDLVKMYVRLPFRLQQQAIEGAHDLGIPTTSHYLFGPVSLGSDAVEHLSATSRYGYPAEKETYVGHTYTDVIEPLARSGMTFTPTIWDVYQYGGWAHDDARIKTLLPPPMYKEMRTQIEQAAHITDATSTQNEMRTLQQMIDAGVHIAIGTDSPVVPYGVYYHMNLQAMVAGGISSYDTLRAATVNGARVIGMSKHLGTITPGKLADLVFIDGDPLADITAAARVRKVMQAGTLHTIDDLITPPPAQTPGPVPSHTIEPTPQHAAFWWHHDSYAAGHSCCR